MDFAKATVSRDVENWACEDDEEEKFEDKEDLRRSIGWWSLVGTAEVSMGRL